MLIQNVQELRVYLGRAVNASFEAESLTPFISLAEDQYINRAFGSAFIADLAENHDTTEKENLLKLIKRSLAFYSYHKYLPYAIGNDGDGGLVEPENTNTKPVRIGVLEKRQRASIENASDSMEAALASLFAQKSDFTTFFESDFGKEIAKKWFRTADELSIIMPFIGTSYRLLFTLQKYFDNAVSDNVLDILGTDILGIVKAYHAQPSESALHKALYDATRRFIAFSGYQESLLFLQYHQTPEGIRVLSEFDGINNSKSPDPNQWVEYKRNINTRTEAARNTLIAFLNKHAEDLPSFKTSPLYKPSQTNRGPDNKKYKSILRMN